MYTRLFAKQYYDKEDIFELSEAESNICESLAELWAYILSVVPEEHSQYTIFDFVGDIFDKNTKQKKTVVSPEIVINAKNSICQYCWGLEWGVVKEQKEKLSYKEIMKFLRNRSIVHKRMDRGENIVIYGESSAPIGRTMLSSIVMKEIIKLRVTRKLRIHTYDWIDFNTLIDASVKDSLDLADYRSCDFLVIDNIIDCYRTVKQNTFITDHIDSFFIGRFEDKLPVILVFKFDIDNPNTSIENMLGVGVSRIVNSSRTFKIPLSEGLNI